VQVQVLEPQDEARGRGLGWIQLHTLPPIRRWSVSNSETRIPVLP
jgi:hypothetical protein